ncbi:DNA-binding response regulator [Winogradskyella immobilis]|uniref:Response regulator transcription factor n=1 Tax=Winogradskyella immobilis TaxID=2816852 RepID=A0ABS8EML3_9FLAO|nr:response regulator transcription factor [Winogradskyella immobilis]MCC1484335.1 response regulator transcription factor [Winogradskyella immobilis]MCG0016427.1 response regulator transcription factor [Winogradskyella immobilis]
MKPSILIADDHPLVLKGLQDFLIEKDSNIAAVAKNGKEALSLIKALQPDIAILDIQMPFYTGLDIAKICKDENLPTKIALITFEKDQTIYNEAISLNVYGYILKEFALDEIENCIASMIEDKPYFSPELSDFIASNNDSKKIDVLTSTEKRILKGIAENKTAKEIGEELAISSRTVEKHKRNIRIRLEMDSKSTSIFLFAKNNYKFL